MSCTKTAFKLFSNVLLLDTELETELSDLDKLEKVQSVLIRYGKEAVKDEDKNKSLLFLLLYKVSKLNFKARINMKLL